MSEGKRPHGRLLRQRDFRLFWTGETVSAIGSNVTRVALPLVAVVTLDASTFEVGLLTAVSWLPWLIIGLPAGAWVDRWPRRPVMIICDLVALCLLMSVPIAAALGRLTFDHLFVAALLVGTASMFFQTAYQVYLPSLVGTDDLPEANATLQGSESAAQMAGPGLAGAISQLLGAVVGLLLDAITFAISAMCLASLRTQETVIPPPDNRPPLRRQMADGLAFVGRDPYLRVLAAAGAASNLALTGYQSILIVFLVREVGLGAGTVGLLLSGISIGGLLGAIIATTLARGLGTARGSLVANFAAGPFALLFPLAEPGPRLVLVVLGGMGVGTAVVAGNVLKVSFRQTYTPRALLGRTVVSMQFLNYGTIPVGALVGGALGNELGLRSTMWIMVVAFALTPLILLIGPMKRDRDFPTGLDTEEPLVGQAPS